jgi:uncharacterized membrane protein
MKGEYFLSLMTAIQIIAIFVMLLALLWLKFLLSDAIKMNIPMMVVHIIVLLSLLIFTVLDLYYYLKLEKVREARDIISFIKLLEDYDTFNEITSFGLFVCEFTIAEMLRRLSKRINID